MSHIVRNSGIPLIGDLQWGTTFCHFYETVQDLLGTLVPYFAAGLKQNELCLWILPPILTAGDVQVALRQSVDRYDEYLISGQLRIVPHGSWPTKEKATDAAITTSIDEALSGGFEGLRFACEGLYSKRNKAVHRCAGYNAVINDTAIAMYAYRNETLDASGLLKIVKKHMFTLVKTERHLELLENSQSSSVCGGLELHRKKFESIYRNMTEGFAFHRIVPDNEGNPCDYVFLEVNPAFERLSGLSADEILGKRATAVLPKFDKEFMSWIEKCGRVALAGPSLSFETHSVLLDTWYSVSVFSPQRGFFSVLLSNISEKKASEEALRKARERSEALNRISESVHSSLNTEDILMCLISEGFAGLGSESAAIFVRKDGQWIVTNCIGMPDDVLGRSVSDIEKSHAVLAVNSGKPVAVSDTFTDERVNTAYFRKHGIRSVITVPLLARGQPIGVISFNYHHAVHHFTENEMDFASQLFATASIALDNARLFHERERDAAVLRESEERFAIMFRSAPIGICLASLPGETIYDVNTAWLALTGYSFREEVIGKTTRELGLFSDPNQWAAILEKLNETGSVHNTDTEITMKTGHRRTIRVCLDRVEIKGSLFYLTSIADITERIHMVQALKESEARYRELVKFAPAAIYEIDYVSGRFTEVNDVMCRLLGYRRDELLLIGPEEILSDQSKEHYSRRKQIIDSGERPDDVDEFLIRTRSGGMVWAMVNSIYHEVNGRIVGASVIATDITERRRAEEALRESEIRYRHLVQYAPAGICEVDLTTGLFLEVNDVMCRLLGYSREDFLAMQAIDIFDQTGASLFKTCLRKAERGEIPDDAAEFLLRTVDGRLICTLLNITFQRKGDRNPSVSVIATDITYRKRAEEELQRYAENLQTINKDLSRFNRAMVDRELRMIELKQEINSLHRKLGLEPPYKLDFMHQDDITDPIQTDASGYYTSEMAL